MNKLKKCVGKEGFQRINYLYQVSNILATQSKVGHVAALNYSNLAVNISKKTVQRLDIDIKRTLCKRCRSLMIPGVTSRVRVKKKKVLHTCLKCQRIKIFDTNNKYYVPWSQMKESLVELLDYSQDLEIQTKKKEKLPSDTTAGKDSKGENQKINNDNSTPSLNTNFTESENLKHPITNKIENTSYIENSDKNKAGSDIETKELDKNCEI